MQQELLRIALAATTAQTLTGLCTSYQMSDLDSTNLPLISRGTLGCGAEDWSRNKQTGSPSADSGSRVSGLTARASRGSTALAQRERDSVNRACSSRPLAAQRPAAAPGRGARARMSRRSTPPRIPVDPGSCVRAHRGGHRPETSTRGAGPGGCGGGSTREHGDKRPGSCARVPSKGGTVLAPWRSAGLGDAGAGEPPRRECVPGRMISQLFVLSPRGDTIISRECEPRRVAARVAVGRCRSRGALRVQRGEIRSSHLARLGGLGGALRSGGPLPGFCSVVRCP